MQRYSGHIRVIACFHATFKDFYRNWTVGTAKKRRRRREEEKGGGVWILVWAFPRGVECDRKKRFLLPGDPRNELSASENPLERPRSTPRSPQLIFGGKVSYMIPCGSKGYPCPRGVRVPGAERPPLFGSSKPALLGGGVLEVLPVPLLDLLASAGEHVVLQAGGGGLEDLLEGLNVTLNREVTCHPLFSAVCVF